MHEFSQWEAERKRVAARKAGQRKRCQIEPAMASLLVLALALMVVLIYNIASEIRAENEHPAATYVVGENYSASVSYGPK
jgi:hypothetical protein